MFLINDANPLFYISIRSETQPHICYSSVIHAINMPFSLFSEEAMQKEAWTSDHFVLKNSYYQWKTISMGQNKQTSIAFVNL